MTAQNVPNVPNVPPFQIAGKKINLNGKFTDKFKLVELLEQKIQIFSRSFFSCVRMYLDGF